MRGPGAVVIPRQEYSGGVSHALPKHFTLDLDYQMMRFHAADVHVASPELTYYFTKPVWMTLTYDNALDRVANRSPRRGGESLLARAVLSADLEAACAAWRLRTRQREL